MQTRVGGPAAQPFVSATLSHTFLLLLKNHSQHRFCLYTNHPTMAPAVPSSSYHLQIARLAHRGLVSAAPTLTSHHFQKRGLSVNHTQGVTLGVIAAYVVIIALLWNLPYVRWVLWPFKVCFFGISSSRLGNS